MVFLCTPFSPSPSDSYQFNGQMTGTQGADEGQQKKEVKENKEKEYMSKDIFSKKMKAVYPKRKGNLAINTSYNKVLSTVKSGDLTFEKWCFAVD